MIKSWHELKLPNDTLEPKDLVRLATNKISDLAPTVVVVTGSVGKTTTKEVIKMVLSEKLQAFSTSESSVNLTELSLDILSNFDIKDRVVVTEVGAENPEYREILTLLKPDILVITAVDQTNLGKFATMEGVIAPYALMLELLKKDGIAVLNGDDRNIPKLARVGIAKKIYYSQLVSKDVYATDSTADLSGVSFMLNTSLKGIAAGRVKVTAPVLGAHTIYACLANSVVASYCGLGLTQIKAGLAKLTPLPGRLNLLRGLSSSTVIDDSHSSTFSSTLAAFEVLRTIDAGRKIVIFGDLPDLGSFEDEAHKKIGERLAEIGVDLLVVIGDTVSLTADSFALSSISFNRTPEIYRFETVESALESVENILKLKSSDVLLVKGSQALRFPKLTYQLILDKSLVDVKDYEKSEK